SLELGNYIIEKPLVNFPDSNAYFADSLKYLAFDRNGTLGGEILSRFKVIFNFPQEKIYLKKNSDFKKAFYFNLSGLTVRAKGSTLSVFEIADVRANSVADQAGLKRGDLIASINGFSVKDLYLNQINGLLNSKPGKKIRLEVRRSGQLQSFEFRLEDQI